jgi:chromosomal replication initiation ATPase DnaA
MSVINEYCNFYGIERKELPSHKDISEGELCNKISELLGLISVNEEQIRYNPARIFDIICNIRNQNPDMVSLPSREPEFTKPRQIFFHIMREIDRSPLINYSISLKKIGAFLACRHNPRGFGHSNVYFGWNEIRKVIEINPSTGKPTDIKLKKEIDEIWKKI